MFQTSYTGISAFIKGIPFQAGICKWWFIPVEDIALWPTVDPFTQFLTTEPVLHAGKAWYGEIKVPNSQLGFTEELTLNNAGFFYRQKISGFHPGDSGGNRINYENLPYHRFAVVAKQRAGGLYLLFGTEDTFLNFVTTYKTKGNDAAATDFQLVGDSLCKAQILTTFDGDDVTPPEYSPGTTPPEEPPTDGGNTEIIPFDTEPSIVIDWTPTRSDLFGTFPEIQVWVINDGEPELTQVPISCDAQPPATTEITVILPGIPGFIVLK